MALMPYAPGYWTPYPWHCMQPVVPYDRPCYRQEERYVRYKNGELELYEKICVGPTPSPSPWHPARYGMQSKRTIYECRQGADSYNVYFTKSGSPERCMSTEYFFTFLRNLKPETEYNIQVTAVTDNGIESKRSERITHITKPENLQAERHGLDSVIIPWKASVGPAKYKLDYIAVHGTVRCFHNLKTGTEYKSQVAAVTDEGIESKKSEKITQLPGIPRFPYDKWRQRYGRLSEKERHRMLVFSTDKERYQENEFFGYHLWTSFRAFTGKNLRSSAKDFDAFCWEIVHRIPEDKWMKFVRLHLNLTENEIQEYRRQGCVFTTQQQFDIFSSPKQRQNQKEKCSNAKNDLGKENKMKSHASTLRQNYGKLEVNKRMSMLMLSKNKVKAEDILEFASFLKCQFEKFTKKKLKFDVGHFDTLCWEIVDRIPEDKWMKFVRLHLNLTEAEIQAYRRQHCALTERQQEAVY